MTDHPPESRGGLENEETSWRFEPDR